MTSADSAANEKPDSTRSPSNECGLCGWPIGENTRHEQQGEVCNVIDTRNERLIGWKRFKKLSRKMYKD